MEAHATHGAVDSISASARTSAGIDAGSIAQIYLPDPRTRPTVDVGDLAPLRVVSHDHKQPVLAVSRGWRLDRSLQNLGEDFVGDWVRPKVSDRARRMDRLEQSDFAHGFSPSNTGIGAANLPPNDPSRILELQTGPKWANFVPVPMSKGVTLDYADAAARLAQVRTLY
jgi:hypothetical protein